MALDLGKHRLERGHAGGEAGLQRRIRAGLDRPGVAVGNEEAAPAAQQRRQAHREPTRAAAAPFARGPAAGCSAHPAQSSRIRPSLATFEPGQASSSCDRDAVEVGVGVVGVVMERDQAPGVRGLAQTHALVPGRVAPALEVGVLLGRIGGVVDHDLAAADQLDDGVVEIALAMLGIGDVADRSARELDPIAGGAVRVIERRGAQDDPGERLEHLAGGEVVERDARVHDVERHREDRRAHHAREHLLQRAFAPAHVAGPQLEPVAARCTPDGRTESR